MSVGKIAFGLTALLLLAQPAQAADWPTRPVTVVVPLGAGGNTDMMARLGAQRLSEKFGQPFIVENRPSAGGALGTGAVATAAPDGYTILFSPSSMLLLTPMVQKVPFDADKQLVPVVNVGTGTQMIAIRRSLPVKTLPEFLAHAKANPGKLNFVIAGANNIAHLAPVLLFARAGVEVVMIPAKSGPQAVQDLMAGQVDFYFGNTSELLPHAESDKIRLIAVGTPQRIPVAPDLPTVAESFPGFEFSSWNGFSVPAGTPEEIITAIRNEITALTKTDALRERLSKLGIVPGGLSKEETVAVFRKDKENFAASVKAAGISAPQ
ncbi:MAG TPA: tripartite tricarboxylate transporter substrate binding protein [Xanthobacteraceae bacterium]|nr:tripartite tricarboxylate transporter substrate binding protein [Xanthobacteraceae bacterium]